MDRFHDGAPSDPDQPGDPWVIVKQATPWDLDFGIGFTVLSMATQMANHDAIEMALTAPMDWEKFEQIVAEILQQDDFPRLRKLGGRGDLGIDAVDEVFFEDESHTETVVQVTSEKTQIDKFQSTVSRLRQAQVNFRQLVLVYRQPVASPTRTEIQKAAVDVGVSVDVRDQSYLVAQLAKPGSNIFSRHFEDLKTQVHRLLSTEDPLASAKNDRLRHAMLASLGAYVINPRAKLARQTLFEKTVLAALVAAGGPVSIDQLQGDLSKLVPEETLDAGRIRAAVTALEAVGDCVIGDEGIRASERALLSVGRAIAAAKNAYSNLLAHVLGHCSRARRLDDATKGYLERNVRRALLSLFRSYGPIDSNESPLHLDEEVTQDLLRILGVDVQASLARSALFALGSYAEDPESWTQLSTFARSYSALAIRNLDPVGRRWQQTTLGRTVVALDTDAVLHLIVEDLPDHSALRVSLGSMSNSGVTLAVSEPVLREVADNFSRAIRTFRRFAGTLQRMSPAMVDSEVWHAVVRGYYYARRAGDSVSWSAYWARYYDVDDPERFVRFLLGRKIAYKVLPLDEIPESWHADLESIAASLLKEKEQHRLKAEFRDAEQQRRRIAEDVRMAMHLAQAADQGGGASPRGYLASEDRAFLKMEHHPDWAPRPQVLILTHALPELAEFVCGAVFPDDLVVRLLFEPAIAAAAHMIEGEIQALARIGVDLRTAHLSRLEWDLARGLRDAIQSLHPDTEQDNETRLGKTIEVIREARRRGYSLDPGISRVARSYDEIVAETQSERDRREQAEANLRKVAKAAAGITKKGRRRVNKVLRELGIQLDTLEEMSTEDPARGKK